ncbi:MAG: hypothetical protein GWN14_23675, partial [candidate division Zixibacteria bacterium]|nr:hypothetical protein [candidate division Zixibacteria bacterium]
MRYAVEKIGRKAFYGELCEEFTGISGDEVPDMEPVDLRTDDRLPESYLDAKVAEEGYQEWHNLVVRLQKQEGNYA